MEAAKTLTVDKNSDGTVDTYGLVVESTLIRYAPFIWGAGGEIVDDVDHPTRLTLDTPEAKAGIQWFMDLGVQGHNVVPSEAEVLAEDDLSRFMNGRAAMLMQSRRAVPTLRKLTVSDGTSLPFLKAKNRQEFYTVMPFACPPPPRTRTRLGSSLSMQSSLTARRSCRRPVEQFLQ